MAEVVDLLDARASRGPPVTRFTLEARDAGTTPGLGHFLWTWTSEDSTDPEHWHPSTRAVGAMLRQIADRFDPPKPTPKRVRVRDRRRRR